MMVKRGEIYYADLSPVVGSEQGGLRPVLIVQNDVGNRHSPTVIAAANSTQNARSTAHRCIRWMKHCKSVLDCIELLLNKDTKNRQNRSFLVVRNGICPADFLWTQKNSSCYGVSGRKSR